MKRKFFAITLVIAMSVFTLVGCGKSENSDSLQTNAEVLPAEGGSVNEIYDSETGDNNISERGFPITEEDISPEIIEKAIDYTTEGDYIYGTELRSMLFNDIVIFYNPSQTKYVSLLTTTGDDTPVAVYCSKITADNYFEETLEDGSVKTTINGININDGTEFVVEFTETSDGRIFTDVSDEDATLLTSDDFYGPTAALFKTMNFYNSIYENN